LPTVLIVDDDRDIRETLSAILAGEGYAVREAADGEDALALLTTREVSPHLILLDIMMPRMDGHEFLAALALRPEFDALPVIVISARERLVLTRARAVMTKPIDLDELLARVAEICQMSGRG
jgi:two-component system chemotaxis response regulator CheY